MAQAIRHITRAMTMIFTYKVKVKFTLEQAMKAHTGRRGIPLRFP